MPLEKYSRLILFLLLLTVGFPLYAQKIELSGVVKEEGTSLPVEQATVKLLQPKDSALITGSVSLTDGTFVLKNVKKGSYLINVSFVGYTSTYKAVSIDGKTAAVDLGTFMLQPESYELTETVITAKAPEMVMRNDTMENGSLVMQRHSAPADSLFSSAQSTEIFYSSRGSSSKSTVKTNKDPNRPITILPTLWPSISISKYTLFVILGSLFCT